MAPRREPLRVRPGGPRRSLRALASVAPRIDCRSVQSRRPINRFPSVDIPPGGYEPTMNDHHRSRARAAGLTAAVASAFAASICCIGPIVAATLGLTSLGALARYESLRPLFAAISILFLAFAFFLTFRRRSDAACEPGSVCDVHGARRIRRLNLIVISAAAIVVAIVLTFPTWSNWILG